MIVPDDLRYTKDHEWVRLEGSRIRVGITDYAQDALGDIVFVQLPEIGTSLNEVTRDEERMLRAAAAVQRETGAPISTHTTAGTIPLQQVRIFEDAI